jgi:hypothetical protein
MVFQLIGLSFITLLTLIMVCVPTYLALQHSKFVEENRAAKKARKKEKKRLKKLALANSQTGSPSA